MFKYKLALGAMSDEVVKRVYLYSHNERVPLMLIASRNQVDYGDGYTGWTTSQFAQVCFEYAQRYPLADVLLCRDHCGPGFKDEIHRGADDISLCRRTIEEDLRCGFGLVHVDACRVEGFREERWDAVHALIDFARSIKPDVYTEVGVDENDAWFFLETFVEDLSHLRKIKPTFYVMPTGSCIRGMRQDSNFDRHTCEFVARTLSEDGILIKEHNADYLPDEEIKKRRGVVGALNVAPQLGVVQTATVLRDCLTQGISIADFVEECYRGGKWKKWVEDHRDHNEDSVTCALLAGHYHYRGPAWKRLVEQMSDYIDGSVITQVIDRYITMLEEPVL